ncbi:hypothetical protein EV424DRAFT_299436 [Suillus variegatus]|nr:hypothetical protein EV424DRAFT_299436 [Suillus variegatus]
MVLASHPRRCCRTMLLTGRKRSNMPYVIGSLLRFSSGDTLVDAGVKLHSLYGATEVGNMTCFFRDEVVRILKVWRVRFGPNSKIRWVPQKDSIYECRVRCSQIVLVQRISRTSKVMFLQKHLTVEASASSHVEHCCRQPLRERYRHVQLGNATMSESS